MSTRLPPDDSKLLPEDAGHRHDRVFEPNRIDVDVVFAGAPLAMTLDAPAEKVGALIDVGDQTPRRILERYRQIMTVLCRCPASFEIIVHIFGKSSGGMVSIHPIA
jgi:hypothetical protein